MWNNGSSLPDHWPGKESSFGPFHRPRVRHETAVVSRMPYWSGQTQAIPNPLQAAQVALPTPSTGLEAYFENEKTRLARATDELYKKLAQEQKLEVKYDVSSIEANVTWNRLNFPGNKYVFRLEIFGHKNSTLEFPSMKTNCKMKLEPGSWYEVTVAAVEPGTRRVLAKETVRFKSILSRSEMIELYHRAAKYVGGTEAMKKIEVFYRNKPPMYFQMTIRNNHIMAKYMKDANGQPGNPTNNEIQGLFFSGRIFRGDIPPFSVYGSHRFIIDCNRLFNENTRLYFSDFYCNYKQHYVTVVLTIRGSVSDKFCSKALIELNAQDNVFLSMKPDPKESSGFSYWINNNIWVEVYYTEDIDLRYGKFTKPVQATHKGSSTPGGLPNNKQCTVCNLYPLKQPGSATSSVEKRSGVKRRAVDEPDRDAPGTSRKKPAAPVVPSADEEAEAFYREMEELIESDPNSGGLSTTSTLKLLVELARQIKEKDASAESGNSKQPVGHVAPTPSGHLMLGTVCWLVALVVGEIGRIGLQVKRLEMVLMGLVQDLLMSNCRLTFHTDLVASPFKEPDRMDGMLDTVVQVCY